MFSIIFLTILLNKKPEFTIRKKSMQIFVLQFHKDNRGTKISEIILRTEICKNFAKPSCVSRMIKSPIVFIARKVRPVPGRLICKCAKMLMYRAHTPISPHHDSRLRYFERVHGESPVINSDRICIVLFLFWPKQKKTTQ